jgi:DNA repair exonuclease SbcCD nuclease subunit
MKIIETNTNPLMYGGDIHGLIKIYVNTITNIIKLTDVNIVLCGDVGIGFNKPNYYNDLFKKCDRKLKKNNIHLYLIRGNHDNPELFYNSDIQQVVLNGVSNFHIVEDYDIIQNGSHSVLCIGGARSIDKSDRWKWDFKTQTIVNDGWWEDEKIKDIPEGFEEFIKENNVLIDVICTHSAPDFCEPFMKNNLDFWAKQDETLIEDCTNERALLTSIYNKLKDKHKIKYWFYGHFHNTYILIDNDVLFRCMDKFRKPYSKIDLYLMSDAYCGC